MNEIIKFYTNDGYDSYLAYDCLITYDQVMAADRKWLESTHDWVQLAFPNFEPSECVADAPVLDDFTLIFLKGYQLKAMIYSLVFKYVNYYKSIDDAMQIVHNNRRVTRLLKFLTMLGYVDAAEVVMYTCSMVLKSFVASGDYEDKWCTLTIEYWNNALNYKKEEN